MEESFVKQRQPTDIPKCAQAISSARFSLATPTFGPSSCGKRHRLWRAVDQHGVLLEILVQDRRDQVAAERFVLRVLDGEAGTEPRVVITDKLAGYPPAIKRVLPPAEHLRHKRLNNRAENSHLPTRKRERILQRFKSADHAQRFLGPFSAVSNHFRPCRHLPTSSSYRKIRAERHAEKLDVTLGGVRSCKSAKRQSARLGHPKPPSSRLT